MIYWANKFFANNFKSSKQLDESKHRLKVSDYFVLDIRKSKTNQNHDYIRV